MIKIRSCENCKNHVKICKHPWNKHDYSKGSILEIISYGCVAPFDNSDGKQRIIMLDHDSGRCEMHEFDD